MTNEVPDPERRAIEPDLSSPDEEVRRLGVEKLCAQPATEALPQLMAALGDPSWRVRKAVVERLVALIGEVQEDGQFEIVWQTPGTVVGDAWSDFLPKSKDLISDWRKPLSCGNFNVKTGKCGGQGNTG